MKKIMRRGLAAALSLVMALGLLTGCSSEYDPIQEAFGYSKDTVMMTVDGADVVAEDIFFWMVQNADYVASYFEAMGMEQDWSNTMGGTIPMDEYVKDQSMQSAILYSLVLSKAEEGGYTMSEEDKTAYAEDLAAAQEELGGEKEYSEFLKTMLITDEGMERLSSVGVLYGHMADGMFKEGGEYAPTAEELTAFAEEQDLLCAKHILVMTQDMTTGEALSEEDAAAKLATAEDILAQLEACDAATLESKFDELMNEYSEDTGLTAYPDGYVFGAGEMVAEFEEATRALEPGQISGIVESSYGYHIILRQDPAESEQIRSNWETVAMDELVQEWIAAAEVETTEEWDNLTTADFYATLEAYRETIEPAEEEEAAAPQEETTGEETEEAPAEDAGAETDGAETEGAEEAPAEEPAEGEAAE